ncbi:hypothetical protein PPYR_04417 [Photinus pyralis]|uniref:TATA box binding protein associated factor (TAF) histone-like fold domain-containing protein n=1 Tax=Photinus pyralis TaxID=7054 RepID=A0A5N4AY02_PHOPY|nr:uncharacterized protein LOC116164319 isoform X1 [Photinus pyralis]KAB0802231.1 hypothetical protein PPYR_04417 [Photinus pyralis]
MKPSTNKIGNNSKSKKSSKDREKRKSQSTVETPNQTNSEKGSPNKDNGFRKYSGYGVEELTIIAEQSINEHLTEEVCTAFTEDINYRLRHIIYEALVQARLSGQNYISGNDIDDIFDCLQIPKVYGAETEPVWIPFGDQNLYYLDDAKVNLVDVAEESLSFVQPEESILTRKWLPESKEISPNLKQYFIVMCEAIVSKDEKLYETALDNIKTNNNIGPIIEWFYHFGYLLLSKDITYDSLTMRALNLISKLELNPISSLIVSEKQIMLLTRLLLQRLLRFVSNSELIRPICQLLALLCKRVTPRVIILKKMVCKFSDVRDEFALPVICAVNHLGLDAIYSIILPHLNFLMGMIEEQSEPDFTLELLRSYNILCIEQQNSRELCDTFYNTLGEAIIPIWKYPRIQMNDDPEIEYWQYAKGQLRRSRRRIAVPEKPQHQKLHIEEVFPECEVEIKKEIFEFEFENSPPIEENDVKPIIQFKFHTFAPAVGRLRFLKLSTFSPSQIKQTHVTVGKSSLITPVLKISNKHRHCVFHTMMYHNL